MTIKPNQNDAQETARKRSIIREIKENAHPPHFISGVSALLLLIMFVPVFCCTILVGRHLNYNADHKITTLYPNIVLLLFALAALLVFAALFFLLDKIPVNKYTLMGTVFLSAVVCFLFYIMKVEISRCIAFYGGWDCGMVANSARWVYGGEDIGYGDYYYIFINNVPITWLLYVLYGFADSLSGYPYNPEFMWIQFQCLMFALALFFSVMTVLLISKRIAPAILCLLGGVIFLGLCPWQIIPYTDASTIAVPIMVIFLYALFCRIRPGYRYILWLLLVFAGVLGGIIKATCYVAVIAVVAVDFLWLIFDKERLFSKLKKLALRTALLFCGFALASWCRDGMYQAINYVPDRDLQITWTNCFYDGLNEKTTGACSGDGLAIAREYAGCPREFRESIELQYSRDRIAEKGLVGLVYFWLRKQVMTFNDGTFSWFQEGFFHAWDYEDITDSPLKEPLRSIYWDDGTAYLKFVTWSQGIWIFILLGVIFETVSVAMTSFNAFLMRRTPVSSADKLPIGKNNREAAGSPGETPDTETAGAAEALRLRTVLIVAFIGVFLFSMLFEGRARYLLTNIPLFVTMACLGCCQLSPFILRAAKRVFRPHSS